MESVQVSSLLECHVLCAHTIGWCCPLHLYVYDCCMLCLQIAAECFSLKLHMRSSVLVAEVSVSSSTESLHVATLHFSRGAVHS